MCPGRDDIAPLSKQKTEQANDAGDLDVIDAEIQQASFDTVLLWLRVCLQALPPAVGKRPVFGEVCKKKLGMFTVPNAAEAPTAVVACCTGCPVHHCSSPSTILEAVAWLCNREQWVPSRLPKPLCWRTCVRRGRHTGHREHHPARSLTGLQQQCKRPSRGSV